MQHQSSHDLGSSLAGAIKNAFVGFVASLCTAFSVSPDSLKRPGVRPNEPPPSGGFSSLIR